MADRSRPAVLVDPVTGAKRRCASKSRYAVAHAYFPNRADAEPELHVVFRTSNPETLKTKGMREARRHGGAALRVYDLSDASLVGFVRPSGFQAVGRGLRR